MHVKKGDNVKVLSGADKGKSGKVLAVYPGDNRVLVEGVNVKKIHEKAKRQGEKGKIAEKSFPIHISNVKKAESAK